MTIVPKQKIVATSNSYDMDMLEARLHTDILACSIINSYFYVGERSCYMAKKYFETPFSQQVDELENYGAAERKTNYCVRESFKDIFGVYFLEKLKFDGKYDIPLVSNFSDISHIDYLALYSDKKEYFKTDQTCICFYQYDHVFDGIHGLYNSIIYKNDLHLIRYRERFKNVKYIIAPDYSLFGDFPNALQIFNIYRSRVCMAWLIENTNAIIIPNVRWSFPFSFDYCFDGIVKGSNIAIGIMGLIRNKGNHQMFLNGFKEMIDRIQPNSILIYGFVTESNINKLFDYALVKGIKLIFPHSKIDRYKKENALYGIR